MSGGIWWRAVSFHHQFQRPTLQTKPRRSWSASTASTRHGVADIRREFSIRTSTDHARGAMSVILLALPQIKWAAILRNNPTFQPILNVDSVSQVQFLTRKRKLLIRGSNSATADGNLFCQPGQMLSAVANFDPRQLNFIRS